MARQRRRATDTSNLRDLRLGRSRIDHFGYLETPVCREAAQAPKARTILRDLTARSERAVARRTGPAYSMKGSFLLMPLHAHPRFQALLQRMGLY